MGRAQFHLGAAFVALLLALSLGSLTRDMNAPGPLLQVPDLRMRGSAAEPAPPPDPRPVPAVDLGPCPAPGEACDVVRQGVDLDGLATWWHRDGTVVKLASERVRGADGGELLVPVVVSR